MSVFCFVDARYLPCSLCRFFCVVSFRVVYFVLFVTTGISFCSEIQPMLGWKASGKISWQGRVLSGGEGLGLRVWGFMTGGV
jgi:hypothetical protein